jgi:hypothetical protein
MISIAPTKISAPDHDRGCVSCWRVVMRRETPDEAQHGPAAMREVIGSPIREQEATEQGQQQAAANI